MSAHMDACGKVCNTEGLSKGIIRVREDAEESERFA